MNCFRCKSTSAKRKKGEEWKPGGRCSAELCSPKEGGGKKGVEEEERKREKEKGADHGSVFTEFESRGVDNCEPANVGKSRREETKFRWIARGLYRQYGWRGERWRRREETEGSRCVKESWREGGTRGTTGKVSSNSKAVESRKNRKNEDIRWQEKKHAANKEVLWNLRIPRTSCGRRRCRRKEKERKKERKI